jgi:hypothetical protein
MKLLICGSRSITDEELVYECIDDTMTRLKHEVTEIIEGDASGVDKLSGLYANCHDIPLSNDYKPDWKRYGKGAGFIRSKEMVDACDLGIAIWDGKSKGTEFTIEELRKQNKLSKIYIIKTLTK